LTEEPSIPTEAAGAEPEPGRRSLLGMLASYAALTVIVVAFSLAAGALGLGRRDAAPAVEAPQPELLAFLGPLATGERFDGFRISRVDPIRDGGLTLEIEGKPGERFVVDLRKRSPAAPQGISETAKLALYLRTDRSGAPTSQTAVQACAALAAALQKREESGHEPPPLESLQPRGPPPP
jgi:hypothetical protein